MCRVHVLGEMFINENQTRHAHTGSSHSFANCPDEEKDWLVITGLTTCDLEAYGMHCVYRYDLALIKINNKSIPCPVAITVTDRFLNIAMH